MATLAAAPPERRDRPDTRRALGQLARDTARCGARSRDGPRNAKTAPPVHIRATRSIVRWPSSTWPSPGSPPCRSAHDLATPPCARRSSPPCRGPPSGRRRWPRCTSRRRERAAARVDALDERRRRQAVAELAGGRGLPRQQQPRDRLGVDGDRLDELADRPSCRPGAARSGRRSGWMNCRRLVTSTAFGSTKVHAVPLHGRPGRRGRARPRTARCRLRAGSPRGPSAAAPEGRGGGG